MRLVSMAFVLAVVLGLAGVVSAQTTPSPATVPASQQAVLIAPAAPLEVQAPIELWQIFAAPSGGTSSPQPQWTSCTFAQCRQPCKPGCTGIGCISVCDSLVDCTCHCDC
jgi:hypothetical protein